MFWRKKPAAPEPPCVAVLGAGAAGLSAAAAILRRSPDTRVDVFEASGRTGGVVVSGREGGFAYELGPNSMAAKHGAVHDLIHAKLGLGPRVMARDVGARKFYVAREGKLAALPGSLGSFFGGGFFSARGKAAVLGEVFRKRLSPEEAETESVDAFFRRRFGREVAEKVIDPAIAGIYSGSTAKLSMKHALNRVWLAERAGGSVIGGLLRGAGKKKKGKGGGVSVEDGGYLAASDIVEVGYRVPEVKSKALKGSFTFDGGICVLTDALAAAVTGSERSRLRLRTPVKRVNRDKESGLFSVNGSRRQYSAVISTIPPHAVEKVRSNALALTSCFGELARRVAYAPISVVVLGYKKASVGHKLDGFGVLIPSTEKHNGLLGVTFSSSNYPATVERDDELYVTAFVGGSRYPDKAMLPGSSATALAAGEVQKLLGTTSSKPLFSRVKLWRDGIPQLDAKLYNGAVEAMDAAEVEAPGFIFTGNYRGGVGFPDALQNGMIAAERALVVIARRRSRRTVGK